MKRSQWICALLLLISAPSPARPIDTLAEGRRLVASALADDPSAFLGAADAKFVSGVGGAEQLRARLAQLRANLGKEVSLDFERAFRGSRDVTYHRVSKFERSPLVRADLTIDLTTGQVTGFRVQPTRAKPAPRADYRHRTVLKLPFGQPPAGMAWLVTWGGDNYVDNYHDNNDTYFAIDTSPRMITNLSAPTSVETSPCWGLPILAAAPGRVALVREGVPDQPKLGELNRDLSQGPGNHVILDHGNGEFTLYAHLRRGSVAVAQGASVETGDTLGSCGNSGASVNPHLHFQLMDSANLDTAQALPFTFVDYFAPLRHVAVGSPKRGDMLLPGASHSTAIVAGK